MSQKTESSEFAPGFLWQLCLLTAVVLGFVIYAGKTTFWVRSNVVQDPGAALFPWIIAGKQTIENGVAAFSGRPPKLPAAVDQARVLAAVLITFVICPTAFLLGWRMRRSNKEPVLQRSQFRISSLLYAFSGVITLFVAVSIIPINVASKSTRHTVRQSSDVQFSRDLIVNEIHLLALDIYQYRLLPRDLAGGGGSYRGYKLLAEQAETQNGSYSVSVEDDEVMIHAQSISYPTASVEVKVDTLGKLVWWNYSGAFQ
jgi:hypothetical protein